MNTGEFERNMPKDRILFLALSRCTPETCTWFDDLATPIDKSIKSRIDAAIRITTSWRLLPGSYPRRNAIEFMAEFRKAHTEFIVNQATKRLTA